MKAEFPYLDEHTSFIFPSLRDATDEGIVAAGGNLSPGMLLSAYRSGIFPWYSEGQPILWWSPDPRFVLFPDEIHISTSLKKVLKKNTFDFSFDTEFERVITECSDKPRPGQDGTWITHDMIDGYVELHSLGYAHSLEIWRGGRLVGGLYGVSIGPFFFGESMFSHESNASKAGLVKLAQGLTGRGFICIDCQVFTEHLAAMGAKNVPREIFLTILAKDIHEKTIRGSWTGLMPRVIDGGE